MRFEYEVDRVLDLLALARERGGVSNPSHPALAQARHDGYAAVQRWVQGGLCEVWVAVHPSGKRVAIKCVREDALEPSLADRLLRSEHELLSELDGAAGLEPIGLGGSGAASYLALPWVEGEPLDQAIALQPASAANWVRSALERLAAIHNAGVIHGDIKPQHLVATGDGVAVLDFGLARRVGDSDHASLTPRVAGRTPEYAPPDAEPSKTADAYSIGRVLEQVLPHLTWPTGTATRRVAALAAELRDDTDGRALLAVYDGCLRRRRGAVRSTTVGVAATAVAVGALGSGVTLLGQWPELFAAAVPGVVIERAPAPLGPWSTAFQELSQNPASRTVLHRPSAIAVRATAPNASGEIAWLLHTNEVEVWSPQDGTRLIAMPEDDRVFGIDWGQAGELLAVTQSGVVWDLSGGVPRPAGRLDPETIWFTETADGVVGWSHQSRRVVRDTAEGLGVEWPASVDARPLRGATPGWVVVDDATREILSPARDGDRLKPGETVTAAHRNEAGDVALGLSTGDLLWSGDGGAWERLKALDREAIRAICITPDSASLLIGSKLSGVCVYDMARREVAACRDTATKGLILGLGLDPMSDALTVVTNWHAEMWKLTTVRLSQTDPSTRR